MAQPDLKTKDGALYFLDYHTPDRSRMLKHTVVNSVFRALLDDVWNHLPDGPGKTRFIHALNKARMEANSCIANEGA